MNKRDQIQMGRRVDFCWHRLPEMIVLSAIGFALLRLGAVDARVSKQKLQEIEIDRKLTQLNKPAVKSIKSADGDIIDCVNIYKQPAFDHPALRNHKIQMIPTEDSSNPFMEENKQQLSATTVVSQTWQRSGSCPDGTVPIRRIRRHNLLQASSLENYGKKMPETPPISNKTNLQVPEHNEDHITHINSTQMLYTEEANRSATYLITQGYNYIGARADINVWNPKVEFGDEFTTAQLWLRGGDAEDFNSLEAGWMVNPKLYGDRRTRLFAYWTNDASKKTGCFDLVCSGFVQTSKDIVLGARIEPTSSHWGTQYQISINLYMDTKTSNWWLVYGSNKTLGYWPGELFSYLSHSAIMVMWGGQVHSSRIKQYQPHTSTEMGSGDFGVASWGHSCFIQHIRIRDYSLYWKYPEWVSTLGDEFYCYSIVNNREHPLSEPIVYFGGPGRNYNCP